MLYSLYCDGLIGHRILEQTDVSRGRTCGWAIICKSLKAKNLELSVPSGNMPFSNREVVSVLIFADASRDRCGPVES